MTFLPASLSKGALFQQKSQNWSWDWYVIMIKMNEKLTALFIGILWFQKCGKHFRRPEGDNSRTRIGFNTFLKEATRWGSSIAWIPKKSLFYIRAIHGHPGGNLIALELMGHVAIPCKWKEFLFHRGCSSWCHFNPQIRTHHWRTRKQRGKTDHLLHTSQPIRWQSRRTRTWRWPQSREKYTITASGNLVRTPSSGSIQPEHRIKNYDSGRQGLMPWLCTTLCQQIASTKWFLKEENELYWKDSRRPDLRRR